MLPGAWGLASRWGLWDGQVSDKDTTLFSAPHPQIHAENQKYIKKGITNYTILLFLMHILVCKAISGIILMSVGGIFIYDNVRQNNLYSPVPSSPDSYSPRSKAPRRFAYAPPFL